MYSAIRELRQTSSAWPSQWEGTTIDDRPVYIRYRNGYLSVQFGPVGGGIDSAVDAPEAFSADIGGMDDGVIDIETVFDRTGLRWAP